jgi:hypothetical protein
MMAFQMNASDIYQEEKLVYLTHLFNRCLRLFHCLGRKQVITLPKPGKDIKFPQNLRPISLLPTANKLLEKVILNIVQKHIEERSLLNTSQFGLVHVTARHCNV